MSCQQEGRGEHERETIGTGGRRAGGRADELTHTPYNDKQSENPRFFTRKRSRPLRVDRSARVLGTPMNTEEPHGSGTDGCASKVTPTPTIQTLVFDLSCFRTGEKPADGHAAEEGSGHERSQHDQGSGGHHVLESRARGDGDAPLVVRALRGALVQEARVLFYTRKWREKMLRNKTASGTVG